LKWSPITDLTSSAITLAIESTCGGETMPLLWFGREARSR
jgi:hypothetical protein